MNTNETQQVDIPADADWIDPLKAYNKGYRAGIEKMRDAATGITACPCGACTLWREGIAFQAKKLLVEETPWE